MAIGRIPEPGTGIPESIIAAKGDILTGTANDTPAVLSVGTNGHTLVANSSTATGLEWAAPAGGKVINIVNTQTGAYATGTTQIPLDNTIPQNTEGDQYMSLSYTPTSAASKLQINVVANGYTDGNAAVSAALFQDSVANALAATVIYANGAATNNILSFSHTMTAATTSAITFKVRIGADSATTFDFNGRSGGQRFNGVFASSITVMEYTA